MNAYTSALATTLEVDGVLVCLISAWSGICLFHIPAEERLQVNYGNSEIKVNLFTPVVRHNSRHNMTF